MDGGPVPLKKPIPVELLVHFAKKVEICLLMKSPTSENLLRRAAVLVLTSSYPKELREPSSIFIHQLSRELQQLGWRIIVLAPNFPGGKKLEQMEGVEIRRFNYFIPKWQRLCYGSGVVTNLRQNRWIWAQAPFFLLMMLWHAWQAIRREKIDLIHAHWVIPQGLVAAVLKWVTGLPVVLTAHGGDAFAFQSRFSQLIRRIALRQADVCSVNSQYTGKVLAAQTPISCMTVIPMGVDLEFFQKAMASRDIKKELDIDGEMILFVGRLVEKKGVTYLVSSLPFILKKHPRAHLVIVGEGAQRPGLEAEARMLGISSSVHFMGRLPHQDLPHYFHSADLFAGPSIVDQGGDTEGLGIVFLEASASGLPIISTGVGGSNELVQDGVTGLVVPQQDPEQLSLAILRLLDDPELRSEMGRNAQKTLASRFSWAQIARDFSRVFTNLVTSHHPSTS